MSTRSLAKAGDFGAPWQDFITRVAWGEIWGDPTLPWKTRSLLTLAMMVALHREEEFKLHFRAGAGERRQPSTSSAPLLMQAGDLCRRPGDQRRLPLGARGAGRRAEMRAAE